MTFSKSILLCLTVLIGGCAQTPPTIVEKAIQYDDPIIPEAPIPVTERIRDVSVIETTGERGGAALRAQEDLDVLYNSHYVGVEPPITDNTDRTGNDSVNRLVQRRTSNDNVDDKSKKLDTLMIKSSRDKSIYKDKSVYSRSSK